MTAQPMLARHDGTPRLAGWLRFVALDLRTLAPHLKTVILTVGALVILVAIPTSTAPAIQLVVALGALMMIPAHLFSTDERAGLDLLYGLLPLRRRTVVVGRYATIALTVAASAGVGTLAAYGIAAVKQLPVDGMGVSTCYLAAAMLILPAIQTPLFFMLGYAKARILNTALLFATAIGFFFLLSLIMPGPGTDVPVGVPLAGAGALAAGVACLIASATLSTRLYSSREF